jgi:branched-chain amino acid transport system substrate-binding protein
MKKINIIAAIVLIGVLGGYLYLSGNKGEMEGKVIKVGQISALSGFGSDVGQEERNGALLAVEYINKNGGVEGRKIEMISEDVSIDKLKVTSSAIQKLVNVDKVLAIVGPQWDDSASIAVPLSLDLKIPIISPNSSPQVEEKVSSPYFFGTFYSDEVGIKTILKFAKKKGYKRVAIVQPAGFGFWKYTSDLMKNHAKDYGVEIVSEEYGNDLANTDYKTLIAKAKQTKPDAVFGSYADLECLLIQQAKNQGLNVPLLSTESAGTPKALANCTGTLEGSLYYSTPGQDSKYAEFEKAYIARFGSKPLSPSAVTSYDAMLVTVEAMRKTVVSGRELSREGIMNEITKIKFTKGSSMPEIVFDKMGFVITKDDAFVLKGVRGGEFVEAK